MDASPIYTYVPHPAAPKIADRFAPRKGQRPAPSGSVIARFNAWFAVKIRAGSARCGCLRVRRHRPGKPACGRQARTAWS